MVAILQLAMRHPRFGEHGESRGTGAAIHRGRVRVSFAHCPTVLRLIARGEDPDCDRVNWSPSSPPCRHSPQSSAPTMMPITKATKTLAVI